jgi:hypothetical protein
MKKQYIYGKVKNCPICGERFQARDADSKSYVAIYCSHACRNKARAVHHQKPCRQCEKVFKPIRASNVFCSKQCAAQHKKENYKPSFKSIVNKKIALFCCGTIHRCLRGKNDKTASLLGYTVSELKSHLESHFKPGMSWDNYGKGHESWSIDHTRPISSFPKSATIAEINALGNLRPMWHKENCSKGNKWERQ